MLHIIKRAGLGALFLIIMPLAVMLSGWAWKPNGSDLFIYICYLITETASYPWAGITCIVLAFWFLWLFKLSIKKSILLLIILAAAVVSGQVIKSVIKESVEESRPFVMWLEAEYHVDDEYFYNLPRQQRAKLVNEKLTDDERVPEWLKLHWENETGYAFPSGHTLFTTSWALISIVLLWPRRHYMTITVLVTWSIIVAVSRLVLGMHWPLDLILATLLSSVISIIVGWACLHYKVIQLNQTSVK